MRDGIQRVRDGQQVSIGIVPVLRDVAHRVFNSDLSVEGIVIVRDRIAERITGQ